MQQSVNLWLWLGPYIVLLLFMVYAMMEFTVSMLVKRPVHARPPLTTSALRARLLALEQEEPSLADVESKANSILYHWKFAKERVERFVRSRESTNDRLHIFLDDERHELCICESSSSSRYFVGLNQWIPRIGAFAGYNAGPPGMTPFVQRIAAITLAGGWTFRPVILPFDATERGVRLRRALTPAPLKNRSALLLWGIIYPLSYCLAFAWLFAFGGPEMHGGHTLGIFFLSSVIWWGVWALLAWAVCGFPRFWRRN